ncbi:MAG: ribbon-helix-helix domain-containing protein [Thermoanaerobaculaceae bacterium]|jgi:hypothetical protein|nr:ribbon-helix-helix domain-containing protein [Thermoanaerobaculaceae bacterium]
MKVISLHVDEGVYRGLQGRAARLGRPVADLIRDAMESYVRQEAGSGSSVLDLLPHDSGKLLRTWLRTELQDEMRSL